MCQFARWSLPRSTPGSTANVRLLAPSSARAKWKTNLLSLRELLDSGIHALLKDSNLLVLLLAKTLQVIASVVELGKQIVDLYLLGLKNHSVNVHITVNETYTEGILELGDLTVVLGEDTRNL